MKKCPRCNIDLPDGAAFCGNCGTNLSEANVSTTDSYSANVRNVNYQETPINNEILESAKAKNRNAKLGLITIISVSSLILLILLILIINAVFGSNYKKPIKRAVALINTQDKSADHLLDVFAPDFALDAYNDISKTVSSTDEKAVEDFTEKISEALEEIYDDYIKNYGDDYKLSIIFKNAERLEEDDDDWDMLESNWSYFSELVDNLDLDDKDTIEDLASDWDIELNEKSVKKLAGLCEDFSDSLDSMKIQDAYKVKVKITSKGSKDDNTTKQDLYVIKIDGKWILDFTTLVDEDITFELLDF